MADEQNANAENQEPKPAKLEKTDPKKSGFVPENLDRTVIAIPLLIQVYFNSGLAYGLARWLRVPHSVAAPGALIGASNFFELAVATAISSSTSPLARH